jgi:anthranilate phosphoribosyltransferase
VPDVLAQVAARRHLSRDQARDWFTALMDGRLGEAEIADVLTALARKGEHPDEIAGAAEAMRAHVTPVRAPAGVEAIDTCGTGGDGISTFNVSTTAAIIAAAAGAVVAKHGNRTNTRVSGSAEVLAALGVHINADVATVERCLAEVGIGFLFAPRLHPAMAIVAPIRKALGIRTIFNLLGPLSNPAGVRRQIVGVPQAELIMPMAGALQQLGVERAMVVHGHGGLCDLSVTGPSTIRHLERERQWSETLQPSGLGLADWRIEQLLVDSPATSARVIRDILEGKPGAPREHALLNAAGALLVAGRANDFAAGLTLAAEAVDSGRAADTLARWVEVSHGR